MSATAATAKFSVAYLFPANRPSTIAPSDPGSFFDWRTLSTTTLIGHGWRMSATVSPSTASSASVSGFQCGRSSWVIRGIRVNRGPGSRGRARGDLHQLVIRVDVIDVLGRDELMLHEHGGRHRPAMQDVERGVDDLA